MSVVEKLNTAAESEDSKFSAAVQATHCRRDSSNTLNRRAIMTTSGLLI